MPSFHSRTSSRSYFASLFKRKEEQKDDVEAVLPAEKPAEATLPGPPSDPETSPQETKLENSPQAAPVQAVATSTSSTSGVNLRESSRHDYSFSMSRKLSEKLLGRPGSSKSPSNIAWADLSDDDSQTFNFKISKWFRKPNSGDANPSPGTGGSRGNKSGLLEVKLPITNDNHAVVRGSTEEILQRLESMLNKQTTEPKPVPSDYTLNKEVAVIRKKKTRWQSVSGLEQAACGGLAE